jgi:NRAMP (natural resistance-associated macrophage protein)-like metal ion transporter
LVKKPATLSTITYMNKITAFFKKLGPGFITGIADDDPSGTVTYAQTGILFGYGQLWLTLFSIPFMIAIQEMCGRLAMTTGKGITTILRNHYSRPVLFLAVMFLVIANVFNIGADVGAMAASAQLVFPLGFGVWVIGLTLFTIIVLVYTPYPTYVKFLKYLSLTVFSYIIVALIVKQEWRAILHETLVPQIIFSKEYLLNIVAMLGTTISPYLFFWQADEEVEEMESHHKKSFLSLGMPGKKLTKTDLQSMRTDTAIGMFLSNLIAFFVIITTASTLHAQGVTTFSTVDQIAQALKPLAGNYATIIFALGILGTGLLAIPVLAGSAAYALSEAFGWKHGLGRRFKQAKAFYGVIIVATLIGVLVNFTSIDPMLLLYYSAVLNALLAPPIMIILLLVCNNKKIMGEHTNSSLSNLFSICITVIMTVSGLALVGTFLVG